VIHVGKWKLQALLANRMRHKNTFLVGDTAHTYTPAGGFGMNSGFQDAHQVVHFLDFVNRNPKCNKEALFDTYNRERRDVDSKYLKKSIENYELTQETA
jgi:2-polyprenyl-6-methoxyphenol hydroxylase-like FAD-dependent oxidoreductase